MKYLLSLLLFIGLGIFFIVINYILLYYTKTDWLFSAGAMTALTWHWLRPEFVNYDIEIHRLKVENENLKSKLKFYQKYS